MLKISADSLVAYKVLQESDKFRREHTHNLQENFVEILRGQNLLRWKPKTRKRFSIETWPQSKHKIKGVAITFFFLTPFKELSQCPVEVLSLTKEVLRKFRMLCLNSPMCAKASMVKKGVIAA